MADNKKPGDLEGEPYATIDFKIVRCGAVQKTKKFDCDLAGPSISGLKEDFAEAFDVPAENQKWYFEGKLLKDDDTLWNAGIQGQTDETEIKVVAT